MVDESGKKTCLSPQMRLSIPIMAVARRVIKLILAVLFLLMRRRKVKTITVMMKIEKSAMYAKLSVNVKVRTPCTYSILNTLLILFGYINIEKLYRQDYSLSLSALRELKIKHFRDFFSFVFLLNNS